MAGYLAVLHTATRHGSGPLRVPFADFFDAYFLVSGSPANYPYLLPFSERADLSQQYQNPNVAGSYAPSSLRSVHPLHSLCSVEPAASGVTFTLVPDHGKIALRILKDGPLPAASLAAYLYRDYAFAPDAVRDDLYRLFESDFGSAFIEGPVKFGEVFLDDAADLGPDIFEHLGA